MAKGWILPALVVAALLPMGAFAQDGPAGPSPAPAQQDEHIAVDAAKFFAGAALALGMHEGGHLVFDVAFSAQPRLEGVRFGPFPFFAVTHRGDLPPRREFTISSAGFWVQDASNEWLLTRRPGLRREHAPFAKGLFAFNVLNSVGYGIVAFARAGPFERDTRGMADASGVDERAIGTLVIMPAVLDSYRYLRGDARWATWASRIAKVGSVLLVVRKH